VDFALHVADAIMAPTNPHEGHVVGRFVLGFIVAIVVVIFVVAQCTRAIF